MTRTVQVTSNLSTADRARPGTQRGTHPPTAPPTPRYSEHIIGTFP